MLIILHGDNIEASRNELSRIRQSAKGKEQRYVDGKSADLNSLTQVLESQSMFGGDLLVIVERLFTTLGRKSKQIEEHAKLLVRGSSGADIVVWEDKELTPGAIKSFGTHASARLFKIPVLIFQFLDGLRPGSAKPLLGLYEQLIKDEAPELLFMMTVRRIRHLVMAKENIIPEGMQPWQAGRLTNQAKFFTINKLLTMEKQLLAIEYSIKSGRSPLTLKTQLEQFLIDL